MKTDLNSNLKVWQVLICTFLACCILYWWMGPHRFKNDDVLKEASTMIERHEGTRHNVYNDSRFIPTIGIGFNLNNPNARGRLKSIGVDYDGITAGDVSLTTEQIHHLFYQDVQTAVNNARKFLPSFDKQPREIQIVLIDMSFNLGLTRLNQFVKFHKALTDRDYLEAAKEMIDSRWFRQTGNRSRELVGIVRDLSLDKEHRLLAEIAHIKALKAALPQRVKTSSL